MTRVHRHPSTAHPSLPVACLGLSTCPSPSVALLGCWLGQGLAMSPLPAPGARGEKSLFS